jgi:UDP-glucose:(heptosyl)LPS alpha-1,3-glucosyltransferase
VPEAHTDGVNIDEFTPDNRKMYRDEVRKSYGFSEDDIVLVFVGWEFKRKGLKYVIDALPKMEKRVKLLVVGGDSQDKYLRQATELDVRDRVVFAGHSRDVKRQYAAADIFVFPTAYESFSMATLEAVASGLPILATKVNGTEELIEDGVNGFFIGRDGDDIAGKVNRMLDENMVERMGRKARESALPHSWDIIAKRTEELYREVAE